MATTRCQYGCTPEGQNRRPLSTRRQYQKVTFQECHPFLIERGLLLWPSGVSSPWGRLPWRQAPSGDRPHGQNMGPDRKWHYTPSTLGQTNKCNHITFPQKNILQTRSQRFHVSWPPVKLLDRHLRYANILYPDGDKRTFQSVIWNCASCIYSEIRLFLFLCLLLIVFNPFPCLSERKDFKNIE